MPDVYNHVESKIYHDHMAVIPLLHKWTMKVKVIQRCVRDEESFKQIRESQAP